MKGIILAILVGLLSLLSNPPADALEKLNFGTSVRTSANWYLPIFAAEEKEFWKQNGLEVEWVPFEGGTALFRAIAAGSIKIGGGGATSFLQAAVRGVPAVMIAEVVVEDDFYLWVRTDSGIKRPEDLRGKRIGVSQMGVHGHTVAQIALRELGLDKYVKFVASGGMRASLAGLKTGIIDAVPLSPYTFIMLKLKGEITELMRLSDFLPKPWVASVLVAHKDFVASDPATTRKAVKAFLQATSFVMDNPRWAKDKMKAEAGYSEEAAEILVKSTLALSKDGKIKRKALQNVLAVSKEYRVIPPEKVLVLEQLYTGEFVPVE